MPKTDWMQQSGEILPLLKTLPLTDPGQSEWHKGWLFTLSPDAAATPNPAGSVTVGRAHSTLQTPEPQHSHLLWVEAEEITAQRSKSPRRWKSSQVTLFGTYYLYELLTVKEHK